MNDDIIKILNDHKSFAQASSSISPGDFPDLADNLIKFFKDLPESKYFGRSKIGECHIPQCTMDSDICTKCGKEVGDHEMPSDLYAKTYNEIIGMDNDIFQKAIDNSKAEIYTIVRKALLEENYGIPITLSELKHYYKSQQLTPDQFCDLLTSWKKSELFFKRIDDIIEELDKEDVAGHLWWDKFKDFLLT